VTTETIIEMARLRDSKDPHDRGKFESWLATHGHEVFEELLRFCPTNPAPTSSSRKPASGPASGDLATKPTPANGSA